MGLLANYVLERKYSFRLYMYINQDIGNILAKAGSKPILPHLFEKQSILHPLYRSMSHSPDAAPV